MRKQIITEKAPAAVGPYSQAIETNELVFISGQLPIDYRTNQMGINIEEQTRICFENLTAICEQANVSLFSAVKVTVLLADINDFPTVNHIYAAYFTEPYPARVAYAVSSLPKGALVEIDAIISKKS